MEWWPFFLQKIAHCLEPHKSNRKRGDMFGIGPGNPYFLQKKRNFLRISKDAVINTFTVFKKIYSGRNVHDDRGDLGSWLQLGLFL